MVPSKGLTPFIWCYREHRWPPDISVSPHYVPFSSTFLFGNRSQWLAGPTHTRHPHDTNGQIGSSTKLEQRSRRVQAQCRSHNSCHREDLAARADRGRRSALETGGHHLRKAGPSFWANRTENKKGRLTCQKEAHSCRHSSCSCTRSLIRLTRTASIYLICRKHGGQSTVVT